MSNREQKYKMPKIFDVIRGNPAEESGNEGEKALLVIRRIHFFTRDNDAAGIENIRYSFAAQQVDGGSHSDVSHIERVLNHDSLNGSAFERLNLLAGAVTRRSMPPDD